MQTLGLSNTPRMNGVNPKIAVVSYFCNGASAPVAATIVDHGDIVSTITGASGKTTVTFRENMGTILGITAQVAMTGDAVDSYAQIGAITKGTASAGATCVVKLKTGATNTDVAAAAGSWVTLIVVFDDDSATNSTTLS